jgi:hypothetical protein
MTECMVCPGGTGERNEAEGTVMYFGERTPCCTYCLDDMVKDDDPDHLTFEFYVAPRNPLHDFLADCNRRISGD